MCERQDGQGANTPGNEHAKPRKCAGKCGGRCGTRASLKLESLEPRILMSATWADADTFAAQNGATEDADLYTGDAANNSASGLGGNDLMYGGDGNDTLYGNAGDDTLAGQAGNDTLYGGDGNDKINGGDGNDNLYGDAGNDQLNTGNGTSNNAYGGAGDDQLIGGTGSDYLQGDTGSDTLQGGAGDDYLIGDGLTAGQGSADVIQGGDGNDAIYGAGGNDSIDGGAGTDTVYFQAVNNQGINVNLSTGTASSGEGVDSLSNVENVTGTTAADTIVGDQNNNVLLGSGGADTLHGGAGNDVLAGGDGGDALHGGAGDDVIYGNAGPTQYYDPFAPSAYTGTDTAHYTGNWRDYDITQNSNGSFTIHDRRTDGDGTDTVHSVEQFQFADGLVSAADLLNHAPTAVSVTGGSIAENAQPGDAVATVQVADSDVHDAFTYQLTDNAGGRFTVGADGVIRVADGVTLDHESASSHQVTVRATDSAGHFIDKVVTIGVTDVNEAPVSVSVTGGSVAENAAAGTAVATVGVSDPDANETFGYQLTDNAGGRFTVGADGVIRVADGVTLNHESATSHQVTVRATDSAGNFIDKVVTIGVTDVNEAPVSVSVTGGSVAENAAAGAPVATVGVSDPDANETFGYQLTDNAGGRFTVDSNGVIRVADGVTLDHESASSHQVTVRATDSAGNFIDKVVTIGVTDVNEAPTDITLSGPAASGQTTLTVRLGGEAGHSGNGNFEPAQYEIWADGVKIGEGSIGDSDRMWEDANWQTLDFTINSPNPPTNVEVRFTNDAWNGGSDGDRNLYVDAIEVNGQRFEAEGPNATYNRGWDTIAGQEGMYWNGRLQFDTSSAQPIDAQVPENCAGAVVGTLGTTDDTGDSHTYAVSDDRFEIVDGALKLRDGISLDHEAGSVVSVVVQTTDSAGHTIERTFRIGVSDSAELLAADASGLEDQAIPLTISTNGLPDGVDAEVIVRNVPTGGTLSAGTANNDGSWSVPLSQIDGLTLTPPPNFNGTVSLDIELRYQEPTDYLLNETFNGEHSGSGVLNYNQFSNWSVSNGTVDLIGNGYFDFQQGNGLYLDMDGSTGDAGAITLNNGLRLEPGVYELSFDVAGNMRGYNSPDAVTVTAGNGSIINEQFSLNSNQGFRTVNGQFVVTEEMLFDLRFEHSGGDNVGMLLDNIRLHRVGDGPACPFVMHNQQIPAGTPIHTAVLTQTIDVNVAAVDDVHSIEVSTGDVTENAATGTVVGQVSVSDLDQGQTYQFELADDADGRFTVDSDGVIRVADGAQLDHESAAQHEVTVRVTSSGGSVVEQTVQIGVSDVNEAPIDVSVTGGSIAENAQPGDAVATVNVSDPDAGETFTYQLTNDADGRFTVDDNGVIRVAEGASLDHEAAADHQVTVRVTDSAGHTVDHVVQIGVADVNEAPIDVSVTGGSIAENAQPGDAVATVNVSDPDAGETFTYQLTNDADGRFTVDDDGVIRVAEGASLDHEAAADHQVTVRVTDSAGHTVDHVVQIGVTDVNEAATTLEHSEMQPVPADAAVGTVVTRVWTNDPDLNEVTRFEFAGGSEAFSIDPETGVIRLADPSRLDSTTRPIETIVVRSVDSDGNWFEQELQIQITQGARTPTTDGVTPISPTPAPVPSAGGPATPTNPNLPSQPTDPAAPSAPTQTPSDSSSPVDNGMTDVPGVSSPSAGGSPGATPSADADADSPVDSGTGDTGTSNGSSLRDETSADGSRARPRDRMVGNPETSNFRTTGFDVESAASSGPSGQVESGAAGTPATSATVRSGFVSSEAPRPVSMQPVDGTRLAEGAANRSPGSGLQRFFADSRDVQSAPHEGSGEIAPTNAADASRRPADAELTPEVAAEVEEVAEAASVPGWLALIWGLLRGKAGFSQTTDEQVAAGNDERSRRRR